MVNSPKNLQTMLDNLKICTDQWSLTVNINKTKNLIFRNSHRLGRNVVWKFDDLRVETVDSFCYLGILFNFNVKFSTMQFKQLTAPCCKTLLHMFDTCVGSIASYASAIWGFHAAHDLEKVHLELLKHVLYVNVLSEGYIIDMIYLAVVLSTLKL